MDRITKLSKTIAKQLKHLRKNKKITQEDVINDLGEENISLRSYKTYESGSENVPTLDRLVLLCEYFGCSLDYLVFGKNVTKERFEALQIEAGIDPEEYKKERFERINKRRKISQIKKK